MLALFAVAAVGMAYVMADVGPATAVLSPADIEAAKAANRAAPASAMPTGSYTLSSDRAELMPVSLEEQPAATPATEPEELPRRRSAGSQRIQARNADSSARTQKREWTNTFFDR